MIRFLAFLGLFAVLAVVIFDSRAHFSAELVELKRKHRSDQRNWSVHYSQAPVWLNAAFRYQDDLAELKEIIEPGSLLLSDLASSYVASATLPVYVINVHRHQGRWQRSAWEKFLNQRDWCGLESEDAMERVKKFLQKTDELDYILINHDQKTRHRRRDCLAYRSEVLRSELPKISTRVFTGEHLELYRVD